MNDKSLLEQFRDLEINREELKAQGGESLLNILSEDATVICNIHLIHVLEEYKAGKLSENRVLEWVNTVWFSDAYDYCDEGCECIASIMNKLEEIDEGFVLNKDVVQKILSALERNVEV